VVIVGLTGSVGMGKSTTAGLFAAAGDAVFDADHAVHALYRGRAVALVAAAFPDAVVEGAVDRARLGAAVLGNPAALARLESIVHPLVREEEASFLDQARADGRRIAVLDIPLLFETGRDGAMDAVVVATAPAAVQRARVLARPGMTEEKFEAILGKQMPDAEKRRRAHFVVDTGHGLPRAAASVAAIRRALLAIAG
jgi:dephospho-CoA kinase